jgi:FtsH-binding integral membrane protein
MEAQQMDGTHTNAVYNCSGPIRNAFIRKVYTILSIQLVATVVGAATFMFSEGARSWVLATPSMFYVAMFMPFAFLFGLHCYRNSHPTNLYLLGGFTLCEAYTVGVICAMYYEAGAGMIVLQALILTAAVFVSLSTYVMVTKKDFSFLGAGLSAVLIVLLVWGMLNMFFDFGLGGRMVFSLAGALLFAGYILYDTSNLLHRHGPDDYIEASVALYLDIINLFLYLLQLLRMLQSD